MKLPPVNSDSGTHSSVVDTDATLLLQSIPQWVKVAGGHSGRKENAFRGSLEKKKECLFMEAFLSPAKQAPLVPTITSGHLRLWPPYLSDASL